EGRSGDGARARLAVRRDQVPQLARHQRLEQEPVAAGADRLRLEVRVAAEREQRRAAAGRQLAQAAGELEPRHAGQAEVEQDQAGRDVAAELQRFFTGRDGKNFETVELEQLDGQAIGVAV